MRKDIELRGGNWEEIQENKKWENRDGWRFLCDSQPIPLKYPKKEGKGKVIFIQNTWNQKYLPFGVFVYKYGN